jgi:membrane-associated phospholipid phosphatase
MGSDWMLFGLAWLEKLQTALPEWVFSFFEIFSFMGSKEAYIVVLVAIWAVNYSFAMNLGIILMINNPINMSLKMLFQLPRPYWANSAIRAFGKAETGFGFPSGHSQTPFAFYGYFATQMKNKNVKRITWVGVLLIGLSRYVLGMHFPFDVTIGWALGALFLWKYLALKDKIHTWLMSKSFSQQVLLSFLLSIFVLSLPILVTISYPDYSTPTAWQTNAHIQFPDTEIAPMHFSGALSAAGTLFGLGLGGFWLHKNGGYKNAKNKNKQFVIFVIGLAGVLIIKFGLGAIFPSGESLIAYGFRYFRYGLIGLWISGCAPTYLIKWGLGKKK